MENGDLGWSSYAEYGGGLVIQTERDELEVNLLVLSVENTVMRTVEAGCKVLVPPLDIAIGRCAVVQDPWGNRLVVLDMSKDPLVTDAKGNIVARARRET